MYQLLQLIAATTWFWTFSIGFLVSIVVSVASLFCPTLWWVIIVYAIWIWYDRKTCERGGRPLQFIRDSVWWRYVKYYFEHKTIPHNEIRLDAKKNYIFACFPHGIYPAGPFAAFVSGYQSVLPDHKPYLTALGIQFWIPFIRELFLSIGAVSVSAPSIKHLLSKKEGGNVVSIMIGGGDEAKYSKPGVYKIILNKRKGFVKMALQTGSPLVPVITFGETDIFEQLDFPGFCCVREVVKKALQVSLVLPKGKYLICPNKVPLTTVFGKPIDVTQTENPTSEEIDELHKKFVDGLQELFEIYKKRYVKNPENTFLEIV